jgi:hypothetical protein
MNQELQQIQEKSQTRLQRMLYKANLVQNHRVRLIGNRGGGCGCCINRGRLLQQESALEKERDGLEE